MSDMKRAPASVTMDTMNETRFPHEQRNSSDDVLNLKEAAAVLHCHPKTLRLMAQAHKIASLKRQVLPKRRQIKQLVHEALDMSLGHWGEVELLKPCMNLGGPNLGQQH